MILCLNAATFQTHYRYLPPFVFVDASGRRSIHFFVCLVSPGEFSDNDIHGMGTYKWNDGRRYTGQVRLFTIHPVIKKRKIKAACFLECLEANAN
jgi:hypothetical protein